MPVAYLIGVNPPDGTTSSVGRKLYIVLDDTLNDAVKAVLALHPMGIIEYTGIQALPETVQKLGLVRGRPKQL
jgi:hypothetical protein